MNWVEQVDQAKRDFIPRMEAAQDRILDRLCILADGNSADNAIGLTYLGHLKNIKARWHETFRELAKAENAGNGIMALQFVNELRVLVENMESLAHSVDVRSDAVGRAPGTPSPQGETLKQEIQAESAIGPVGADPGEGFPAWAWALPIGLVILFLLKG